MAFPISPTSGTTHGVNSRVWSFNGYAWDRLDLGGTGGGGVGPAGPTGPGGALGNWGSFWSTANQSATAADTAYAIQFNNTDPENSGVSLVDNTKITFAYKGVYNLQFSAQVANAENNQVNEATFWLKKNGTNIPDTAGVVSVDGKHSGITGYALPAWNWMFGISANDYIELYWHTNDTNVSLNAFPAMASPSHPLSPSVIFTAQQVMYTQVGPTGATGPTGPQGNTGPTGPVGDYVAAINGFTGNIGLSAGSGITLTKSGNTYTIAIVGGAGGTGATGATGSTGPTGSTGSGYTAATITNGIFFITPVLNDGTLGTQISLGYIVGPTGSTGPTGPVDAYVRTFNGRTGDIEGVTSINGATGSITNVAFTNNGNTFSVLQFMNAGISASGGITTDTLNIISGFTANGVTGTIGTLVAFTGLSASQLTGVSAALFATSSTNTLDITSTVDGAGLRIAQSADPTASFARIGSIRLGRFSTTPTANVLLYGTVGALNVYNGISNTYSNMLGISTSNLTIGSANVSGATFSGLVKFTVGISAAGASFSGTSPARFYSGITASGATLGSLYVSGGATVANASGIFSLQFNPSIVAFAGGEQTQLKLQVYDLVGPTPFTASLIPNNFINNDTIHTLPSTTGTLLNTNSGVAFIAQGNTFTTRQVMNAGISAQSGMTLSGRFNFYSGICGAGGITLGSQINASVGISAAGVTSDTGYKVTPNAINAQTSSYILTSGDNGKIITMNAGTGITLTVPSGLPVGYTTTVIRLGSGNVGISAALGVSINSFQSQVNIAGQHAAVSLISYSSDVFNLAGGLTG